MWIDRRKKHTATVRLDEYELTLLKSMADSLDISMGEMLRRALLTTRILLDPDLPLGEMVKEKNWDKPLVDIVKPFPELSAKIGLELKLWEKIMENKKGNSQ